MNKFKRDFKESKIGKVPANWDVIELKEIFEIFAGGDLKKLTFSKEKSTVFKYPIFSNSLNNKGVYGFSKDYQFEPECITITARGDVGRAEYRNECFNAIVRLLVLKQKKKLSCYFVSNFINARMNFEHVGAAQNQLTVPLIEHRLIAIPNSFIEQQKISNLLLNYDALIENNSCRIQLLESMAKLIYDEWFVKFKFPGCETVKMVDSGTKIGYIPEGWRTTTLSDVATINESCVKKVDMTGEIEYIDISSVSRGKIIVTSKYDFENAPGRARRKVKEGDILWSCVRPNLKAYALLLSPKFNTIASTGFAVITPKKIAHTYLYCFLTTEDYVNYLSNVASGSAYPAVSGKDFENSIIVVPPEILLNDFHQLSNGLFKEIDSLQRKNKLLEETRDLLLPKLMSGELDVSDLDIKVSEVEV